MDCSQCTPRSTAKEELERVERIKKEKGCEKPVPTPQFSDSETGQNYFRCPIALVEKSSWFMVDLYNYLEQGFLPCEGGIDKQPAHIMSRLSFVRGRKNKFDREKSEKDKK